MPYYNKWIPKEVSKILSEEQGTILDAGGGMSPFYKATHIIDSLDYDEERLRTNAWGKDAEDQPSITYRKNQYTKLDFCQEGPWPFDDNQFDLALSSHTLEDIRDPIKAVDELSRIAKKVLIITPSRLSEQTVGMSHFGHSGFTHHPWIVYQQDNKLIFRRKTFYLENPLNHISCPIGQTLKLEYGASYFYADHFEAEEQMFWNMEEDCKDYQEFIKPFRNRTDIFESDNSVKNLGDWFWYFRQKYLNKL